MMSPTILHNSFDVRDLTSSIRDFTVRTYLTSDEVKLREQGAHAIEGMDGSEYTVLYFKEGHWDLS